MSALIGALRASLSLETAQFEAGAKRAQRTAAQTRSSFQKSFGGLGGIVKAGFAGVISGLSIGLIVQGAKASLEYASSLAEVSEQLGVTTRDLQVYRYIATQTGITQEEMDKGLARLTLQIGKAGAGSKQAAVGFDALNISVRKADGSLKTAGDIIPEIAEKFEKIPDAGTRAVITFQNMGKAGQRLSRLFSGGKDDIEAYTKELEAMGGILSDEEIQSADLTADKIAQLNNQLKANIAGAIARNSGAIYDLANSLVFLVSKIGKAIQKWTDFKNALDAQAFDLASKNPLLSAKKRAEGAERAARARGKISDSGIGWNVGGSKVILELPPINGPKAKTGGFDPGQFLAGGGGKGKKDHSAEDAERRRLEALRNAFQFDQELLRAQQDVLRAQESLATDYSERAALAIQILNLDQQGFKREMEYAVASGDLSKTQAAQLQAEYDKKDALERQAVLEDEQAQRLEDYNNLEQLDFDLQRDKLESEAQLKETASERRDVELRLLDLAYRQERARLEAILADEKSSYAAKEEARRRLLGLNATYANDKNAVLQNTRGPMEDYLASLPTTAAKAQEALEQLQVQGFDGLIDAAVALTEGFSSAKDALLNTLKQFLQGLLRMQLQKGLGSILGSGGMSFGSLFGGGSSALSGFSGVASSNSAALSAIPMNIPGMATGGSGIFGGFAGIDRNVLSLNGLPIAKVSRGEAFAVGANGSAGGNTQIFNVYANDADSFRRSERQIARDARRRLAP